MIKQYNQYIYKDGQWLLVGVSDQNNFITYVLQKDGDTITLKGDDNSTSDVVIKEFSDEAKAKLENIAAGAQVNVLEGVKVNGTKLTIDGEKLVDISVPTKLSQLTNDADYVTDANYVHTDNNYTTAEKNKLAGIAASADVNTIEQIKVNNSALTPDGNKIVNITVPTKLTDLTNDNNFVTDANYVHTDNNYTTAEKNKLAGLSNYDDTEIKQQIAQAGKIDTIKVNGTAQPVVDKTVSLTIPTVPTNISAFTNDKNYQTEDEVTSLIADAVGEIQTLEYNVVGSLPTTGETGVIYLVSNGGTNPNVYDEYIYINGGFEKIGTTEIDLSGYLTKTEAGETYAQKAEVIQSDWSQNDSNQLDYVKNRTHYEVDNVVSNVIIPNKECTFTITGIGDAFAEMAYDYTEEELAKINNLQDGPATIKVSINGHNFESAIEISNKTFESDLIRISTIDPQLYFIIVTDSRVAIGYEAIGYENAGDNYTINLIIEQNNKEIIKLDKKFLPDEAVLQDELVQSDWNENDETAIDYIKNRTHYIDFGTRKLLDNAAMEGYSRNLDSAEIITVEAASGNGYALNSTIQSLDANGMQVGGEYTLNINNTVIRQGILMDATEAYASLVEIPEEVLEEYNIHVYVLGNASYVEKMQSTAPSSLQEEEGEYNLTDFVDTGEDYFFMVMQEGDYSDYFAGLSKTTAVNNNLAPTEDWASITWGVTLEGPGEIVYKLDRKFLPYAKPNFAEAFNFEYNNAIGEGSHAEGLNTNVTEYQGYLPGEVTEKNTTDKYIILNSNSNFNKLQIGDSVAASRDNYIIEIIPDERKIVFSSDSSLGGIEVGQTYMSFYRTFVYGAFGRYSHVEGENNIAEGVSSHAEGSGTKALEDDSHAEGAGSIASGMYGSHAEGQGNRAFGSWGAHAEGSGTWSGDFGHSEGNGTVAVSNSHAEGKCTVASDTSHAEGSGERWLDPRLAIYVDSFVVVDRDGQYPIFDPTVHTAKDWYKGCFLSKLSPSTYGELDPYMCITSIASYNNSYHYGESNVHQILDFEIGDTIYIYMPNAGALGLVSHSEGYNTLAIGNYQHVQGKYNELDKENKYADIVGNGSSKSDRSNAYTLDWDGNGTFAGKVTVGTDPVNAMDVVTKQYLENNSSDWNQNDETAVDYIKNRTHYIKENTTQTVVENISMTASYIEDNIHSYNGQSKGAHFEPTSSQSIPELENLQPGKTYSFILDEQHICTGILKDITEEMNEIMPMVQVDYAYYLGNGVISNFGAPEGNETLIPSITNFDTGENFGILVVKATMGTNTIFNFGGTYLGLDYETLLENGINDKTISITIKKVDNSYSKLDINYVPNSLVREWLPYKEYYEGMPVHKDGSIYKALETFIENSEMSPVRSSMEEVTPTEGMQIRGEGVIRPDCSLFENMSEADLFNYITASGFAVSASEAVEDDMEVGISLTSFPYRFHKIFDSSMGRFVHMISVRGDGDLEDIILCIPNEYITESGKISIAVFLDETILISYVLYAIMMQDVVWDGNGQFVSGIRVPTEYVKEGFGISFKTNDFVVDTITSVSDHFSDTFKILKVVQNPKWELLHTHFIDGQFNDDETILYYDNIFNKEDSEYETVRANVKPGSIIFNTKGGYKNVHFSISLREGGES